MTPIRIARSFVAAESVAELIAAEYDVAAPVTCRMFSKLLRTQDNDHYLTTAGDGTQYAFRIYQQGNRYHRAESDFLYEIDWLRFLREHELPVSYPIRRRDGGYLGRLDAPEGTRYYALFSLAYGDPLALKDLDQLYVMGETMARIHVASDSFATPHARKPLDLAYLCLLYTSPSPRDRTRSRMPSSA